MWELVPLSLTLLHVYMSTQFTHFAFSDPWWSRCRFVGLPYAGGLIDRRAGVPCASLGRCQLAGSTRSGLVVQMGGGRDGLD